MAHDPTPQVDSSKSFLQAVVKDLQLRTTDAPGYFDPFAFAIERKMLDTVDPAVSQAKGPIELSDIKDDDFRRLTDVWNRRVGDNQGSKHWTPEEKDYAFKLAYSYWQVFNIRLQMLDHLHPLRDLAVERFSEFRAALEANPHLHEALKKRPDFMTAPIGEYLEIFKDYPGVLEKYPILLERGWEEKVHENGRQNTLIDLMRQYMTSIITRNAVNDLLQPDHVPHYADEKKLAGFLAPMIENTLDAYREVTNLREEIHPMGIKLVQSDIQPGMVEHRKTLRELMDEIPVYPGQIVSEIERVLGERLGKQDPGPAKST